MIYLIFLFLSSLAVGSFVNVLIYRIPRNISIFKLRSFCPSCKSKIKWYENIPIFSYIFLKARCSYCKSSISIHYPLVEFSVGLLSASFICAFYINNLSALNQSSLLTSAYAKTLIEILILGLLVAIFYIDFKYKIIPHQITYFGICLTIPYLIFSNSIETLLEAAFSFGLVFFLLDFFVHFFNLFTYKKNYIPESSILRNLKLSFLEKNISSVYLLLFSPVFLFLFLEKFEFIKSYFQIIGSIYFLFEVLPGFVEIFSSHQDDLDNESKIDSLITQTPSKTVLGGGDIVFLAWIALFTSFLDFSIIVFVASTLGLMYFLIKKYILGDPNKQIPLGPFLAIAFLADMIRIAFVSN